MPSRNLGGLDLRSTDFWVQGVHRLRRHVLACLYSTWRHCRRGSGHLPAKKCSDMRFLPREWVLENNGTRNRCKRSILGRKCLTFCERQANMEKWARMCLQKSSAKAETCAATFAKINR